MAWQPHDENRQDNESQGEAHDEGSGEARRQPERSGRRVIFFIVGIVVVGAVAAGIWWAVATFGNDPAQAAVRALDGYFEAAARNDREAANQYIYTGEDADELGADDFSAPFEPDTFFAYREVEVRHTFAGDDGAYAFGVIHYNERPSREFTAVLRRGAEGWGMLRLWLSEPIEEETPASVLLGGRVSPESAMGTH